jgi:preprotein translocase subunit SecG
MLSVLLAIHMIACVALVISVMLQRSEGGALGMGGGGTGGFISGRGAAGLLVKITMGLAAVFFSTSLVMTRLNSEASKAPTTLERELQGGQSDPFDPLSIPPSGSGAVTPAPAQPDPLAPLVAPPSGSAPVENSPAPASPPADPLAPVVNTPAPQPAPQPAPAENGGSATP